MGGDSSKCYTSYGRCSIQGRRREMEDKTLLLPDFVENEDHNAFGLFGVFDGHNGNTCSKYLSDNFPEVLKKNSYLNESPSFALIQTYLEIDKSFLQKCCSSGDKSGSTGVATLVRENQIFIANAGDSRCIICEDARVFALTSDHKPSIPFERERIINSGGQITQGRVQGTLAVARSFGDIEYKDKSTLGAGVLTCEPDIKIWNVVDATEFMVLACDGLWDVMTNEQVAQFVRKRLLKGIRAQKVCESLVKHAYKIGSTDNISVVIVSFFKRSYLEKNPDVVNKIIECIDNAEFKDCVSMESSDISSDHSASEIDQIKQEKRRKKKEKIHQYSKKYFCGDDDQMISSY